MRSVGHSRRMASKMAQPGMTRSGYIFFRDDGEGAGPIAKNIGPVRTEAIREQLKLRDGDAVFFLAGRPDKLNAFAGLARQRIGRELGLLDENRFAFCWIVDFPMFEWNEEEKRIDFSHNPFSMPNFDEAAFLALDPGDKETILGIKARQYDIVCNGTELSSGAIRNHLPEIMLKAFAIAGYPADAVENKFGALWRAFHYGAPPHGGIAPGIDRIVMLLCGEENLREVTLFPMTQRAEDLLMGAPSEVMPKQLRELNLRLALPE
jgi:aspartyl-tRNA synthetase